jgi:hypothetical protein
MQDAGWKMEDYCSMTVKLFKKNSNQIKGNDDKAVSGKLIKCHTAVDCFCCNQLYCDRLILSTAAVDC